MLFVIDRSGSMSGPKIQQVKTGLQFMLRQLEPADTFNIVAYDTEVETFRPELQRANQEAVQAALSWVGGIAAGGGTNIDDALRTGLKMLNDPARPNYVVFLTDGEPTVGERSEPKIIANAAQENHVHARLFAFGVGFDVNGRLLDGLAREMRGTTAYVRPNENIEAPVSALFSKIGSPMMTEVAVKIDLDGGATSRIYPRQMPDLFRGDQLVLVGRYRLGGAARISLTGTAGGKKQAFTYQAVAAPRDSDAVHVVSGGRSGEFERGGAQPDVRGGVREGSRRGGRGGGIRSARIQGSDAECDAGGGGAGGTDGVIARGEAGGGERPAGGTEGVLQEAGDVAGFDRDGGAGEECDPRGAVQ
jgi:Ca-activated chloride channel family protein